MIKGCQRKMIVVQGRDKSVFETAYFVLRRESEERAGEERALLEEANRIINENRMPKEKRRGKRHLWRLFGAWLCGCLVGCGGTLIVTNLIR